jgi:cytochrome c553
MADYKQRSQEYAQKLKDPRWQKKRLEIFERDKWTCQGCWSTTNTLTVHHKYYLNEVEPWDYPDDALLTLCEDCHEMEFIQKDNDMDLISMLRRNFLSGEIYTLAEGFRQLNIPRDNAPWLALGINLMLTDRKLQALLVYYYQKDNENLLHIINKIRDKIEKGENHAK